MRSSRSRALVPWQYFAGSLSRVGTSLVNSANLITKVYFPRLIIPLSGVISTLVDFAIGFAVLVVLLIVYRVPLTPNVPGCRCSCCWRS